MEFVAKIISPGVAEISMPPHQPGTFYFWFVVKEPESKSVYYSNTIPFYYTPVDEIGYSILFWKLFN